jgi:hypothetical protein
MNDVTLVVKDEAGGSEPFAKNFLIPNWDKLQNGEDPSRGQFQTPITFASSH